MSNCIEIVRGRKVVFLKDEIDIEKFKVLVDSVAGLPAAPTERDGNIAWWFLQRNSLVDQRGVVINFSEGRSSHTWRDFEATLEVLKGFMKKPKHHHFVVSDEFDDFRSQSALDVEFSRVTIGGKTREERDAAAKAYVDSLKIDYSKIKVRTLTKDGWVEGSVL